MLLLVGLPGSGKSTFAEKLQSAKPERYFRVNQDALKTRKKCESACRRALQEGKVPIIDQCNFDAQQRQYFLDIASLHSSEGMGEETGGVPVECVVFDCSV